MLQLVPKHVVCSFSTLRRATLTPSAKPRPRRAGSFRSRYQPAGREVPPLRPGETPEQALERRLRESAEVEMRVIDVYNAEDFRRELAAAKGKLLVLEIESSDICQTGLTEEPEQQWKLDKEKVMAPCRNVKGVLQRTARECADVVFLSLSVDHDEGQALADELGIQVLPTVQFYRDGVKLWEHRGFMQLDSDLGEGVLFYGDAAAGGARASEHVVELEGPDDLDTFVNEQDDKVLTVVNVALSGATPCVHVFPAVLALAKSFTGYAKFARLVGDKTGASLELLKELNVVEVPTFIMYRGGREIGRHVGSSRGDLIGQILMHQSAFGVPPPPPPEGSRRSFRKRR